MCIRLARDVQSGGNGERAGEVVGVDLHCGGHQPAGRPVGQGGRVARQPLVEIALKHSLLRPDDGHDHF